MEKLLKEIMDRGFLIYRYEIDPPLSSSMLRPKFVLKKIRTPADNRPLYLENGNDIFIEYFESFDEALDKAKKMIDWKGVDIESEVEIKEVVEEPRFWMMQLMYRHIGLGPRFVDLGKSDVLFRDDAVTKARELAEAHIEEYLEKDQIDGWDIRVRPCNL